MSAVFATSQPARSLQDRLKKQEFRGLTSQGYSGPGTWNTLGQYYVDARRNAVFGQTTFTVWLVVMHPDAYASYKDVGVEFPNDPQLAGVKTIRKLKFLLATMSQQLETAGNDVPGLDGAERGLTASSHPLDEQRGGLEKGSCLPGRHRASLPTAGYHSRWRT